MPTAPNKLADHLKGLKPKPQHQGPLWTGPNGEGPNGGVTQGLLSRFLVCRERFRIYAMEGLRPADSFSHRLEYGSMWHVCERALAAAPQTREPHWEHAIADYARVLGQRYPIQRELIDHWYNVVRVTFPCYVKYWQSHPDVVDRTPLLQEQVFSVVYQLPSGRHVRLRGKWDAVDLIGKGKDAGIFLAEHKTKGDIDEVQLQRELASGFHLQTMLYLVALAQDQLDAFWRRANKIWRNLPISGVRFNVIRRPLSGGKGSIVRHKPTKGNPLGESQEEFFSRLSGIIEASPQDFFYRWSITILPGDIERFRRECLDPLLEQLWGWWEYKTTGRNSLADIMPMSWRMPYGVYNPLLEGNQSDLDEYIRTGSMAGLQRASILFPELAED